MLSFVNFLANAVLQYLKPTNSYIIGTVNRSICYNNDHMSRNSYSIVSVKQQHHHQYQHQLQAAPQTVETVPTSLE